MVSIDEAISKYKEITNTKAICPGHCNISCDKCLQESKQIAEWLEELKDYQDKNKMVVRVDVENMDSIKDKIEELSKYAESQYNKALDDFKKILTIEKIKEYAESDEFINLNNCSLMIFDISEQLKAGVKNETN